MENDQTIAVFEQKILEDARREAEMILARAREKLEDKLAAARGQASLFTRSALARARQQAEAELKKARSAAEMEARNILLLAREQAVEAVCARTREMIEEFRHTRLYREKLKELIAESAAAIGPGEIDVVISARDGEKLGESFAAEAEDFLHRKLGRRVSIRIQEAEQMAEAGVIVREREGRMSFNDTFSARWKRDYPRLRRLAYQTIFGSDQPDDLEIGETDQPGAIDT
ncbi:MAG: V-type ATP synthase subunit E [PVC group bacterium]